MEQQAEELKKKLAELSKVAAQEKKSPDVTEESTKMALIVPLLNALGYNVFDPTVCRPEFNASFGNQKDARVDFALLFDGKPYILIECKPCNENNLDKYVGQIRSYFTATDNAAIGILTNGIEYRFYSDLDSAHVMDKQPFLSYSIDTITDEQIEDLVLFSRSKFDPKGTREAAADMKLHNRITEYLTGQFREVDDRFADFVLKESKAYSGHATAKVKDEARKFIRDVLSSIVNSEAQKRLAKASVIDDELVPEESAPRKEIKGQIVTTPEELEAYKIVKDLLPADMDITYRDTTEYFAVRIGNNGSKTICRFDFTAKKKSLLIPNGKKDKYGRVCFDSYEISTLEDIKEYKDLLLTKAKSYEN